MSSDTAIRVSDVSKMYKLFDKKSDRIWDALGIGGRRYEEKYALHHLDFEIKKGETIGIIGTNGAGKSTLLKIITGVVYPTGGEVEINGKISALLELGAGFNYEYTGLENVYLNGLMTGLSRKQVDEKLSDVLEFADIGKYIYQPVKSYSSGMFVRLAFAVAINVDPDILIVDEALSVGDVFFQAKCYHKFEEFKEMGKTIVFVSHDLSSISKYCDRVYLLNQGEILGVGKPKAMIDAYKRVLVGQYDESEEENGEQAGKQDDVNPEILDYGSGQAKILEYYITDDRGVRTNAVMKGTAFTVHMKVEFADTLPAPIFAMSFKNVQGTEITGTNSMIEKAFLDSVQAGQIKDVTFTQKMSLQGGEYLISFGVTGFNGDNFEVYHRLYDALHVTVVSDKNTVGFYDMDTRMEVKDAAGQDKADADRVIPFVRKA